MTGARRDGSYLLIIGCAAFLLFGLFMVRIARGPLLDFKMAYSSARCLMSQCDPYNESDVLRTYRAEEGADGVELERDLLVVKRVVYPPSTFVVTVPFALLPEGAAQALWIGLIAAGFVLGAVLMWSAAADQAPILAGALVCLCLVSSGSQLSFANPGCLVVGPCLAAAWCLVEERFAVAGVVCLAVCLALKPHDAGPVWLYFLLAGGVYRRRAWQSLGVAAALSLPAIVRVMVVAPGWIGELRANLAAFMARGSMNDPGPAAAWGHGTCTITDLQSIFSVFRDDAHFYNLASYMVCAPLLIAWAVVTVRSRGKNAWLGLAAIAALSMLPVYHRQYDAKLILFAVPACAMLWAASGRMAKIAVGVTAAALVLIGDLPWSFFLGFLGHLHRTTSWMQGSLLYAALGFPTPLGLLGMGGFYLWVYARRVGAPEEAKKQVVRADAGMGLKAAASE
jgi:hypothetical protein